MGWIKPVGTKLVKYGPQAQLVWKHFAAPATAAAQRTFAAQGARRTALNHADTVVEGAILKVMHEGVTYWVVFSGGKAVTAYPVTKTPVADLIADANLTKMMTPDQFRAKQAEASKKRKAIESARSFSAQLRRGRDKF